MPRKRTSRLFQKNDGRWYADFRDYRDVGGRRTPLIPPGQKYATRDADTAATLMADQLRALESARRGLGLVGPSAAHRPERGHGPGLAAYATHYLVTRKAEGKVTDFYLAEQERYLTRAVAFLGADRPIDAITVTDLKNYLAYLRTLPGRKAPQLSGTAQHHHLTALSAMLSMAEEAELIAGSPVKKLRRGSRPKMAVTDQVWLETPDAAAFLAACRTVRLSRADRACRFLHELIATFLLTGGRKSEVFGLEEGDILFDRELVIFRPNRWRRLKNDGSRRAVPLWPQLAAILRPYLNEREAARVSGASIPTLLFPSRTGGLLTGCGKAIAQVERALGWPEARTQGGAGPINLKAFRHTYCAARLQTLDRGEPITEYTVAHELGHRDTAMVHRIYGHLGQVRHRSPVVEYLTAPAFVPEFVPDLGRPSR